VAKIFPRHAARRPPRVKPHGSSPTPASAQVSPLVRTITRIVGVVPAPVRILLGCLLSLALALGARAWLGARDARRLERQRRQLLEDVGLLQAALLPVPPAHLGPLGVSVAYRPAEGPGAGGDFYDVFALEDGRVAVLVGDVSGHGRQALPHTALVRFTLRAYLEAGLAPRVAVQTAGAVLERQLGESFATVVAATYEPRKRVLTYACAGHPPPVVCIPPGDTPPGERRDWPAGEPDRLHAPFAVAAVGASPPIGVGMRTGTRQTAISLPGRTVVCFHTDGVTEARVGAELFGERRLAQALAELGQGGTAPKLLDRVAEETDVRPDDMAACLLNVPAPAPVGGSAARLGPAALVEEIELDSAQAASDRARRFLVAGGVQREEIPGLLAAVRAAAGQAGTAILRVRLIGARPEVTLRREHVARLQPPAAGSRRAAGAAG
jgi:Stage II sporulation protein E (SpoIIE)